MAWTDRPGDPDDDPTMLLPVVPPADPRRSGPSAPHSQPPAPHPVQPGPYPAHPGPHAPSAASAPPPPPYGPNVPPAPSHVPNTPSRAAAPRVPPPAADRTMLLPFIPPGDNEYTQFLSVIPPVAIGKARVPTPAETQALSTDASPTTAFGDETRYLGQVHAVPAWQQTLMPGVRDLPAPPRGTVQPPAETVLTEGAAVSDQPSVARSSAIMAAGSLLSRVTGLMRTVAIGAAIGAAQVGNAYGLANNLPNMVYELLLGGVLGSVLVPYLTRAKLEDPDRGQAYAQRLMTMTLTFLAGATVLAVACAPLLTKLFAIAESHPTTQVGQAGYNAQLHLTTLLGYLILPEIFFYGFAALAAAILNTRGHFAAPTFTPILNNIVVILTAVMFIVIPHTGGAPTPESISTSQVLVLGIGTTLGIVVQAAGLLPALRKVGYRFKPRWDWGKLQLRELGRASGWMLAYVIASEVALIVGSIIMNAVAVPQKADGSHYASIAVYNNAYLIFMMAHGICAVSIMVALMPRLSAAAAEGRLHDLAKQMAYGTRLSAVVLIPITAGYLVLGQPLAISLFEWHSYTSTQASQTGAVIAFAGLGLVPYAISQMQLFTLYALREQKTAGLISFPVAAVRIALGLIFWVALPLSVVTSSMMVANTVSYVVALILGYAVLRRRLGQLDLSGMLRALGKLAVSAAIAAVPAYLIVLISRHEWGTGKTASIATLIVGGIVLFAVYAVVAMILRATDITDVAKMVRSKFAR